MEVKLRVTGLDDLRSLPSEFKEGFWKGLSKSMRFVEAETKKSFGRSRKPGVKTGHLRRSIQSGVRKSGNTLVGWVGSNVEYSAIHELGGRIHARNVDYLKFQIGGSWKFVKEVVIPKRAYLEPAITDNLSTIDRIVRNEILKATE